MDDFDRAILNVVQSDAALSHEAIGQRVNLSASSVRRRLTALRRHGVIERDVSLVNIDSFGVLLIVSVILNEEKPEIYDELDQFFIDQPLIKQAYRVSGEHDYVIIVQAPSLPSYEEWAKSTLMSNPLINRFNTTVVYSRRKFDTSVTLTI